MVKKKGPPRGAEVRSNLDENSFASKSLVCFLKGVKWGQEFFSALLFFVQYNLEEPFPPCFVLVKIFLIGLYSWLQWIGWSL